MPLPKIGETISADQFGSLPEDTGSSFVDRLKYSFADPATRAAEITEPKGFLKGGLPEVFKDIADIVGPSITAAGTFLGAAGGTVTGFGVSSIPGAAIGATAGESVRRGIGQALGVRNETKKEIVTGPFKTGGVTLAGGKALQLSGKFIAARFPKLLGIFTGEGDDVIRTALRNPKEADMALEQGDDVLRRVMNEGAQKVIDLRKSFVKGHQTAFNEITKEFGKRRLSKAKVVQGFEDIIKNKRVKIGKDGKLDFTTSSIKANPGEMSKVKDAYDALKAWDDWTFSGVNELKRLIGQLTRFADEAGVRSKSPTLGAAYNNINNTIKTKLPKHLQKAYIELNKKFADNIDLHEDAVDAFNKGDSFTRIAGVFGKNKDSLRQTLDFVEKQTGLRVTPIVAGRELGMEKTAAFGFLNPRSWLDFFISPKTQAKVVTGSGKIIGKVKPVAENLGKALLRPSQKARQEIERRLPFGK